MSEGKLNVEDTGELTAWLRRTGLIQPDEQPRIRVLTGGVSNRTVLVQRTGTCHDTWVIKQALKKLRVQADWFSDPIRVHREAAGLQCLQQLTPARSVPGFVFEDYEHHLLIMQAVPQPHENWKSELMAGRIEPDYCHQFGTLLGTIHRHSFERCDEIRPQFDDRTFFESLRLEPYYSYAATQAPDAAAFLRGLLSDTRERCLTLVHGDYSPKNILVHEGRIVLLDHEVIHWGDPAFDVGFGLTHLLSKAHHLFGHRHSFACAARTVWQSYHAEIHDAPWHSELERFVVRHTLGCLAARVAGRSPLEYLSESQRTIQYRVTVELMNNIPDTVEALIDNFVERV
ncbi:MAG: phosphotransferase [Fuerstiella sp.]|nr:phosphotransferase [Fuerstiella sp.]